MTCVVNIFTRFARPLADTPHIGEEGDMCDRTFEGECDIDFILRKYGSAGDGAARFGVTGDFSTIPSDLVDLHNHMADIKSMMRSGESVEDFISRLASEKKEESEPTVVEPPVDDKVVPDETKEAEPKAE